MSSTRHPSLHRWSPLHPPLTRSAAARPLEPTTSHEVERGDGPAVLDLREGDERLAGTREG